MRKALVVTTLAALALAGCAQATPSAGSTPQACLDALDAAGDIMGAGAQGLRLAGEIVGATPDALIAANLNDMRGVESFTELLSDSSEDLVGLTKLIEESDYPALAEECRAGA